MSTSASAAILIVDDDLVLLELLKAAIAEDGHRVAHANSVLAAQRAIEVWDYACIIIDIILPDGDGIEFAQSLRAQTRTRDVPILFISGNTDQLDRVLDEFGDEACHVMQKPLNFRWLKAQVRSFANTFRLARELRRREEFLHSVLSAMPAIVVAIDKRGVIFECNDAFGSEQIKDQMPISPFIGYPHQKLWQALFANNLELAHRVSAWVDDAVYNDALGKNYELIERDPLREFYGELEVIPIPERNAVLTVLNDVTERRRNEAKTKLLDESLRFALDAVELNAWEIDLRTGLRTPGLRDHALYGEPIQTLAEFLRRTHPDDEPKLSHALQTFAFEQTPNIALEFRQRNQEDQYRWMQMRAKCDFDNNNKPFRVIGISWDISERKRTEINMRDYNNRLNIALDAASLNTWAWNIQTGERLSGLRDEEIFGRKITLAADLLEATHPDDRARVSKLIDGESLDENDGFRIEFRAVKPNQEIRWLASFGRLVKDEITRQTSLIGVTWDITQRKATELLAAESEERLLRALDSGRMILWDWDLVNKTRKAFGNEQDVLGFRPIDVEEAQVVVHEEDRERDEYLFNQAVLTGVDYHNEFRIRRPDGEVRWLLSNGRPMRDENGKSIRMAGSVFDITARRNAENAAAKANEQLAAALNAAQMISWEWDVLDRLQIVSGDQRAVYGAELESLDALYAMMPSEDRKIAESAWHQTISTGAPYRCDFRVRWPDGSLHWIHSHGTPIQTVDGKVIRIAGIASEVTERKQTELALAASESRLQDAMQAGRMCCWTWQVEDDQWLVSGSDADLFGEKLTSNQQAVSLVHPDDRHRVIEFYESLAKDGQERHIELRVKWRDASEHWVANHGRRAATLVPGRTTLSGVAWDITSRKNVELALAESDRFLRLALEGGGINVFDINLKTGARKGGSLDYQFYGFSPTTREQHKAIVLEEDIPEWRDRADQAQLTGERGEVTYRARHKDGSVRSFHSIGQCVPDENGELTRLVGVTFDITLQKQTETELSEAERRWNFALEGTGAGVWDWDVENDRVFYSVQWKAMLGYAELEISDRLEEWTGRLHHDERDLVITALQKHIKGESVIYASEHRMRARDGSWIWVQERGQVVARAIDHTTRRIVGTCVDISEQRRQSDALAEALRAAENASSAKSSFLASMSHEIRTPMNAVIGMTGLLLDTKLDAKQKEMGSTIRSSGELLLNLINDILDFSKIEAGQLQVEYAPLDLFVCVESAIEILAAQAEAKSLDLCCSVIGVKASRFVGDLTRVRQIIVNLIGNAVKFTATGAVEIHAEIVPLDQDQVTLIIKVCDTGIGMNSEVKENLFTAFRQGDASTTRRFGGTGLGLAITKQLCVIMHGNIEVESERGKGSVFTVSLPLLLDPESHLIGQPRSPIYAHQFVLLGESPATAVAMQQQLEDAGAALLILEQQHDLQQHLAALKSAKALIVGHKIDESGAKFVTEFLRMNQIDIPIILIMRLRQRIRTGEEPELPNVIARISRPILPSRLLNALKKTVVGGFEIQPQDAKPIDPNLIGELFPLRILVAEDNSVNQTLADLMLESLGYRCDIVSNGLEVLDALKRQDYDVILMDVEMPEMDGIEATRAIREASRSNDHPRIVATTAHVMADSRAKFIAAGMNDYISKPVLIDELREALVRAAHWLRQEK